VGHRTLTTSYQPPGGLPARTLTVHLWYPTLDTEGEPVKYLIFPDKEAIENASLAPPVEATGYPVHVHSHGMWGFAGNSAGVMRWFASHGWIAAAPDHAGNTLPEQTSAGIPLRLYYLRPLDIRATLDALETLPPADPLAGKARTARVSMSGHSFGSHSTWAILGARYDVNEVQAQCDKGERFSEPCQASDLQAVTGDLGDPRVVAAVPMAGAPLSWFGASLGSVKKPVQQQSAAGDPVGADKLWEQTDLPGFTWVEFAGGCHQLFGLGGCPDYEDEEGFRLVSVLSLALARRHVLDDGQVTTNDLLNGKRSLSDKISFRIKESTP
jgi:predicted dienelactone hydrolase